MKLNHVFIDKPALAEVDAWIVYCKQYAFKKVYLRFVALQGLYVSAYPPGELEKFIKMFKASGIVVGLHCFSHLIEPTIDLADLEHDINGEPIVIRQYYVSKVNTNLFRDISRGLAKFYTVMGFDGGIYFDGLDYLKQTTPFTDTWVTEFMAETLIHIKAGTCTVECSCPGWKPARYLDCIQAEDQQINFIRWVDEHIQRNDTLLTYYPKEYTYNLGWLSLDRLPTINEMCYLFRRAREKKAIVGCVKPSLKMDMETREKMEVLKTFNYS